MIKLIFIIFNLYIQLNFQAFHVAFLKPNLFPISKEKFMIQKHCFYLIFYLIKSNLIKIGFWRENNLHLKLHLREMDFQSRHYSLFYDSRTSLVVPSLHPLSIQEFSFHYTNKPFRFPLKPLQTHYFSPAKQSNPFSYLSLISAF